MVKICSQDTKGSVLICPEEEISHRGLDVSKLRESWRARLGSWRARLPLFRSLIQQDFRNCVAGGTCLELEGRAEGEPMLESTGLFPKSGRAMPLALPDLHE